jgi:hypothetical protein
MTTPDIAGLCERLRDAAAHVDGNGYCEALIPQPLTYAADTLERQAAEIERLRGAARAFEAAITTDIPVGPGYAEWVAKAQHARADLRAALTGED